MNRHFILFTACVLMFALVLSACGEDDDDSSDDDTGDDDSGADDDSATDDDDVDDDTWPDDDTGDDDTAPPDPIQRGLYDTAFTDVTWHDPSSDRDQPMRVYYPSADGGASIDVTDGPRAMVIFSPGFSAPMNWYFSYADHLASHGFVVMLRNNYVISHAALAETTSAMIDWAEVQAATPGSLFDGAVDTTRVGTSGHSMGGKVSLLTAIEDDRVTASGVVDPVDTSPLPTADYPSVTPELMPSLFAPTLMIGGSDGGFCAPAADNYHQYFLVANAPSIEVTILNSGHVTFCDLPPAFIDAIGFICPTGGGDPVQIKALSNRYLTAFYKVTLDGETDYDYYLTGEGMTLDVDGGLVATDVKE